MSEIKHLENDNLHVAAGTDEFHRAQSLSKDIQLTMSNFKTISREMSYPQSGPGLGSVRGIVELAPLYFMAAGIDAFRGVAVHESEVKR